MRSAVLLTLLLSACASTARPLVDRGADRPLVITVGGLGQSQLDDVASAIALRCNVSVVDAGESNGFAQDLQLLTHLPHSKVILVGHSWGANRCAEIAPGIHAYAAILIDPTDPPPKDPSFAWEVYDGGLRSHNSYPHDPKLIDRVVDRINALAG